MNRLANRAEREEEERDRLALVEYDAEHSARYREQLVPHAPPPSLTRSASPNRLSRCQQALTIQSLS